MMAFVAHERHLGSANNPGMCSPDLSIWRETTCIKYYTIIISLIGRKQPQQARTTAAKAKIKDEKVQMNKQIVCWKLSFSRETKDL